MNDSPPDKLCNEECHGYRLIDGELPPAGTPCDCGAESITDEDIVMWLMRDE